MKILYGIAPKTHVQLSEDEVSCFRSHGHIVIKVPYGRNDQSLNYWNKIVGAFRNALHIIVLYYKEKPDILYLNSRFEKAGCIRDFIMVFLLKAFYFPKSHVLIKTHGSNLFGDSNSVFQTNNFLFSRIVYSFLCKKVNGWLFLSKEEIEIVHKHTRDFRGKIYLIPNIIDPSRCLQPLKMDLPLLQKKWKVLFCGRMVQQKGCLDIVDAIPLMKYKNECQFIFLGEGPELDNMRIRAENMDLSENQLLFTGFISEELSDPIFGQVDVFAFPTYFAEGFAMALFKAVAVGLPIITTPCRAAKDYLKEPENTLWVQPKDPPSVAVALDRLFESVETQHLMNKNNRKLGLEFSKDAVGNKLNNIIKELVSKQIY